jgi:hypothetical protein
MKSTLLALIAVSISGISSPFGLPRGVQANDGRTAPNSVNRVAPIPAIQESAPATPPALQDAPPPPAEASPSDMPIEQSAVVEWGDSQVVYADGATCCTCCRQEICCCEVPMTLCLVDPCDGCSYEACVHLPACCVGTAPVVEWKNGIMGRKIICLCWPCCDKRAKVVVPVFGDVRVWE